MGLMPMKHFWRQIPVAQVSASATHLPSQMCTWCRKLKAHVASMWTWDAGHYSWKWMRTAALWRTSSGRRPWLSPTPRKWHSIRFIL